MKPKKAARGRKPKFIAGLLQKHGIKKAQRREQNKIRRCSSKIQEHYKGQYPDYETFYFDGKGNLYGTCKKGEEHFIYILPTKPGTEKGSKPVRFASLHLEDLVSGIRMQFGGKHDVKTGRFLRHIPRKKRGTELFAIALNEALSLAKGRPIRVQTKSLKLFRYYKKYGFKADRGILRWLRSEQGPVLVLENYNQKKLLGKLNE